MQRISAIKHEESVGKAKQLLDGVKSKLGFVPNMMATMASSSSVIEAYLAFSEALASSLNAKLREQISLTVAEINGCHYCVSAHSAIGKMVGLEETELKDARNASARDTKADASLKFARALVIGRGKVNKSEFEAIRSAGLTDTEISEVVANVALNVFTNYFNLTAQTIVDFPAVEFPLVSRAASV